MIRPMAAADTATGLAGFEGRGAGTDAERRAAHWLVRQIRTARREAHLETFWSRPNWALGHAWHCLLALGGSLLMVAHAAIGGALVLAALLSVLADGLAGSSLGRRLTPERASQNVVSPAPGRGGRAGSAQSADPPVRLIVTANYDAGRTGLAYRDGLRRPVAALKRLAADGAVSPGWLGWLSLELLWLLGVAALRLTGAHGTPVGIVQLVPTAALVVELALLLDLAGAAFGPAAGDNAAGAAVALAVVRALDAAPPRHLAVELVLQGAGDGQMTGLRRHLRHRRPKPTARDTVVLGIGPAGAGGPCWWISDGPLVPLGCPARLRVLARRLEPGSGRSARPVRGRGVSPALPARARGLPALAIGCLDPRGQVPRSHQRGDAPDALDSRAMDALLEFALLLVDEIDADLARTTGRPAAAPAAA
jgi:hypothetical protein